MAAESTSDNWQHALSASYEQLINQLVTHTPQLLGAALLLLLGWLVAWLLSKLTVSLLKLCNRALVGISQRVQTEQKLQLNLKHARLIGRTVFWVTMMFFIAAATSSLGLNFFSEWISSLLRYLPNLLAGVFIIVGGYLLGNLASAMAKAGAQSIGFARVEVAGNIAKLAILFTATVIGIEQLGINIQFVTNMVIVLTGVLCAGIALAFGLGSRELIANTVAAKQVSRHCRINDQIEIAGISGRLAEVTATMLVIETEKGRTLVPASQFMQCFAHITAIQTSSSDK
ncbi:mechanosensitive ion channel family protein [Pseudoalteromonas piscicida]|uniref:mechanosensitive ion channel family protein n=1 Tax=Pseudoalteromonas piscicida TaxID=43662 RepID=UPI0030B4D84E